MLPKRATGRRSIEDAIVATRIRTEVCAGGSVRSFEAEGLRWLLVADLCRVCGLHLQPNGGVNVTHAVRGIAPEHLATARLETEPGTLKPFTKMLCIPADRLDLLVGPDVARALFKAAERAA